MSNRFKKIACLVLTAALCITSAFAMTGASSGTQSAAAPTGTASGQGTPPALPSGGSGAPQGGGADTMTYDYTGTLSGALTANGSAVTSDGKTYAASAADQNAALVQSAGTLTLTNGTLTKSGGDTNGDNCNFYGINSILLAVNSKSAAYVSDSTLSADSEGSNGIFATDNATVCVNNTSISTTAGNSRGLDATYGGTILANLMKITTKGDHCAAIATDRGGGSISAANSTLSTAGSGSPLLYSTGDIEVDNVTGTASGSQIAGMEGLNTILIYHSNLTSTLTKATASDPIADGIIIYQSTSGDAESTTGKTADFEASDSTLKSAIESGAMFYFTNTKANVVLSNTVLDFDSSKANLMTVQGNSSNNWGTAGSNGAEVTFTGLGETLSGNIDVDTISSLDLFLLKNSSYTGTVSISSNSVNTSPTKAPVTVNLDGTSKWIVTGNSTVTNLNAASGASLVDEKGNTVSIVANGSTVVKGTSEYTVTVTGAYSTTVSTTDSNALSTSYIDRSTLDKTYSLQTTFGTNAADTAAVSAVSTVSTVSAASAASSAVSASQTTAKASETASASTAESKTGDSHTTAAYIAGLVIVILGGAGIVGYQRTKAKRGKHSSSVK